MNINVFIMHGSFGNVSENWFPWLANKLSSMNIQCLVPSFPTPLNQSFETWSAILDGYRNANLIDSKSVFVCHSSSSMFGVKYLIKNEFKIHGLITVAGFNNFISGNEEFDAVNKDFYYDEDKCIKVKELTEYRISFLSDNDPYLPKPILTKFADSIDAEKITVSEGGHFNLESGFNKFDLLLEKFQTSS